MEDVTRPTMKMKYIATTGAIDMAAKTRKVPYVTVAEMSMAQVAAQLQPTLWSRRRCDLVHSCRVREKPVCCHPFRCRRCCVHASVLRRPRTTCEGSAALRRTSVRQTGLLVDFLDADAS
ncbi:hypothetical protein MTO96_009606 [Rhipicephalus appendiculatus]